eukprot:g348.t2
MLLALVGLTQGATVGRGKSDLSPVIASQELDRQRELPARQDKALLPSLKADNVIPDVLKSAKEVNGIQAG